MANEITQETFDGVVSEIMEVFEMNETDALEEAVKQFEAQGVNLEKIVREPKSTSCDKHDVQEAVENIRCWVEGTKVDSQQCMEACAVFQQACDKNLAQRCLAAKEGAYPVLFSAMKKSLKDDHKLFKIILECLCSFIVAQPDLLDDVGTDTLLQLLQTTLDSPDKIALVLCIVRHCCQLHEGNRQRFVNRGIIGMVATVLKATKGESEVAKSACSVYRSLTLDDDVRVPFGKSHDHAKLIVDEADGIRMMLDLATEYKDCSDVLSEIFLTLSRLAVRDQFCCQVLDLGGIKNILSVLSNNLQHQNLACSILGLLKTLAGSDPVKIEIIKEGGFEVILEVISKYIRTAAVCDVGSASIAALVLRFPEHSKKAVESGAPDIIIKCMQLHSKTASVQKSCCMAVRNLVSRCSEISPIFLELGAEQLLKQVMTSHKECRDEAKAALRDLGCTVELTEMWKGTGKSLQQ